MARSTLAWMKNISQPAAGRNLAIFTLGLLGLLPGQSHKALMLALDKNCLNTDQVPHVSINSSNPIQMPHENAGILKNRYAYYIEGKAKTVNNDNFENLARGIRAERVFHSPFFYWMEQKVGVLATGQFDSRCGTLIWCARDNRNVNAFSKLIDSGLYTIFAKVEDFSRKHAVSGYAGWTDTSPISLILIGKQRNSLCASRLSPNGHRVFQRGLFLPWLPAPTLSISRDSLGLVFNGKIKTLMARHAPDALTRPYFLLESLDSVLLVFAPLDLSLFLRVLALVLALFLIASNRSAYKATSTRKAKNNEFSIRTVLIQASLTGGLLLIVFGMIDGLLSFTSFLDGLNTSHPSYTPPRDMLRDKRIHDDRLERVNEYGFSDKPVSNYSSKSDCKLAVLGDSFVWGVGSAHDSGERWTSQLAKLIPNCKVFHWGIGGWSTTDQVDFLLKKGSKHKVNALLIGFVDNDLNSITSDNEAPRNLEVLKRISASIPIGVVMTPWSGLENHRPVFQKATDVFKSIGINSKSCLNEVQQLTGIDKPLPRRLWAGVHVDSHPGREVNSLIASCALDFINQDSSLSKALSL